jgi:hypothetical protein
MIENFLDIYKNWISKKEQISLKSKQNKSLKVDQKFMFKEASWQITQWDLLIYEVRIS